MGTSLAASVGLTSLYRLGFTYFLMALGDGAYMRPLPPVWSAAHSCRPRWLELHHRLHSHTR